jgi:HK97 family phage major capsid protein
MDLTGYQNRALSTLQSEREAAGRTILQLRDKIAAEGRDFNSEERAAWDKANQNFDLAGEAIENIRATERSESKWDLLNPGAPKPGCEDTAFGKRRRDDDPERRTSVADAAVEGWLNYQFGKPVTARHFKAAERMGVAPNQKVLRLPLPLGTQERAQSVGTANKGGYSVPTTLANSFEVALKKFSATRSVGTVFRTPGGENFDMVTCDDTSNSGALLAENTTVGAAVDVTLAKTTFASYKFQSGLVLISAELEQDNAVGLMDQIGALLGERLGRGQEPYFTTGTGSSQPAGIVTGSTLGKTTAGAAAITSAELVDLYHSVDPAYRADPSFGWMMHDGVAQYIRKIADTTGRFIWEIDLQKGTPGLLLGRPVTINQSMQATVATGTKTVLCGAMAKFHIRDAGDVRLYRLEERYRDLDQVGMIAFLRSDSKVLNAGTNPLKHLLQA